MQLYYNLPLTRDAAEVAFSRISWVTGAALIASAMLVYPLGLIANLEYRGKIYCKMFKNTD